MADARGAIVGERRIYLPEWATGVVCTATGALLACERHPSACHKCKRWYRTGRNCVLHQFAPCTGDWTRSWVPATNFEERRAQPRS